MTRGWIVFCFLFGVAEFRFKCSLHSVYWHSWSYFAACSHIFTLTDIFHRRDMTLQQEACVEYLSLYLVTSAVYRYMLHTAGLLCLSVL
jgi:hypothetical protein